MFKWLRCKMSRERVIQGLVEESNYYRESMGRIYQRLCARGIYIGDPGEKVTERHINKAQESFPLSVRDKDDFKNDADVQYLLKQWIELRSQFFALIDIQFSAHRQINHKAEL